MENTNVKTNTVSAQKKYKKRSPMGEVWHRLKKNKGAIIGGAFVLVLVLVAFFSLHGIFTQMFHGEMFLAALGLMANGNKMENVEA